MMAFTNTVTLSLVRIWDGGNFSYKWGGKLIVAFYFPQAFGALSPLMTSSDLKLRFNDRFYETTCSLFKRHKRQNKGEIKPSKGMLWVYCGLGKSRLK